MECTKFFYPLGHDPPKIKKFPKLGVNKFSKIFDPLKTTFLHISDHLEHFLKKKFQWNFVGLGNFSRVAYAKVQANMAMLRYMVFLTISEFFCGAGGPPSGVYSPPGGQEGYRECMEFFCPLGRDPPKTKKFPKLGVKKF
jgi:hypothetical protein